MATITNRSMLITTYGEIERLIERNEHSRITIHYEKPGLTHWGSACAIGESGSLVTQAKYAGHLIRLLEASCHHIKEVKY